jgi:hypothetical protein
MGIIPLRTIFISAAVLSLSTTYASAQSTPVDPATAPVTNPNPATSTTTDEEGNNPLAREGDHSPTQHNPPQGSTVGTGSTPIDPRQPDASGTPKRDSSAPAGMPNR